MTDQLLVVDDDPSLREVLSEYLSENGFTVTSVPDGEEMWRRLERSQYDLVILDLMLPGDDGFTVCRELRSRSPIPIIMLTARGEHIDRIVGLEIGADDYVPKPFNPRELLARIRALLRRSRTLAPDPEDIREYGFARWTLNIRARTLVSPDGVIVPLSYAEFQLLKVFLERPKRILSREQLIDLTKGRDAEPFDRSIDMQVSRLRRRLGDSSRDPSIIKTVRNGGYMLEAEVERSV